MPGKHRRRRLQQIALPLVEHAGLQLGRAADLRHGLLIDHVLLDQGRLLLGRVPPTRLFAHRSAPFPCVLPQGWRCHLPAEAGHSLSRDGSRLASLSWDRTAKVWDTKSWRELARLTHRELVEGDAISPDGTHLATYTAYDGVRIVPLDPAELIEL